MLDKPDKNGIIPAVKCKKGDGRENSKLICYTEFLHTIFTSFDSAA